MISPSCLWRSSPVISIPYAHANGFRDTMVSIRRDSLSNVRYVQRSNDALTLQGKPDARPAAMSYAGRATVAMASAAPAEAAPQLTAYVWGDASKEDLGACPLCHELLLFLGEKDVPFERKYVDYANLPTELKEQSKGEMPVLKDSGHVSAGLDNVIGYVEDKFPEPALGKGDTGSAEDRLVEELWQAFLAYLGGGKEQDQATLNDKLRQVAQILEKTRGPFVGADYVCATDVRLAPRLRHILVALPGLKSWSLPEDAAPAVHKFLDEFSKRASWQNTLYSDEAIISFWKDRPTCTETDPAAAI